MKIGIHNSLLLIDKGVISTSRYLINRIFISREWDTEELNISERMHNYTFITFDKNGEFELCIEDDTYSIGMLDEEERIPENEPTSEWASNEWGDIGPNES